MVLRKKILIVEDEQLLADTLSVKLRREGFDIFHAENGLRGLELVCQEQPHLILLDIMMPIMDGLSMLKKLRTMPWGKDVPVIILTNMSDTASLMEAVELGTFEKTCHRKGVIIKKVAQRGMKKYLDTRLQKGVDDFFIKSNCDLNDIIKKIRLKLRVA